MKRVLFSLLCGTILVFGYFVLLGLLYQIFQVSFAALETLLLPLNFPYDIYKKIFGYYSGDPRLLKVITIIADILIYSIPFYLIFTLSARLKAKRKIQGIEIPPEPPLFD